MTPANWWNLIEGLEIILQMKINLGGKISNENFFPGSALQSSSLLKFKTAHKVIEEWRPLERMTLLFSIRFRNQLSQADKNEQF